MAAGLGFKTFTTGEVLTAADTNGYLMQGILVFASAAARDAAITSPQEGQCCYLKDTDAVLTYSGAAWVGFDDSNAIQNTIVDAKGDIVAASGSDTPARLAVGNNGETLVADSSTSTGLAYREDYAAGKNKIINGDFGVWQRGTSFSNPTTGAFAADRWSVVYDGTGATRTISQQTFTPGTAPVAGYEGRFFYRFAQSVAGTGGSYNLFQNRMEDVRTFAGQTVTVSFWGKAAASTSLVRLNWEQEFGTGGSPSAGVSTDIASTNFTLTTSWQRFTVTTTVPSISGKTIGTTTPGFLGLRFWIPVNSTFTLDIWGVQVEESPVVTAFQTATGTLQGELAACQRYFEKSYSPDTALGTVDEVFSTWTSANGVDTTLVNGTAYFKVTKRIQPTITIYNTSSGTTGSFLATSTSYTVSSVSTGTLGIGRIYATTSMTANTYVRFHWTASAEL